MSGEHAAHAVRRVCIAQRQPIAGEIGNMVETMVAGWSLEAEIDAAHSAFQECGTTLGALTILDCLTMPTLLGVADLMYVPQTLHRATLVNRVMADRWGASWRAETYEAHSAVCPDHRSCVDAYRLRVRLWA